MVPNTRNPASNRRSMRVVPSDAEAGRPSASAGFGDPGPSPSMPESKIEFPDLVQVV
jgi:hypothetical protein